MLLSDFSFQTGGLHLARLGLWLDPQEPQTGPERVFVSHAHADHTAAHREVILSSPTSKLMQARMPGERKEHVLSFRDSTLFEFDGNSFQITLLPAGHIFGSAMALVEAKGGSLLYTGDFKLRPGLSAEPCEPRRADVLIMETTYGRPQYVFPPVNGVLEGVVRFCREALDNDETAVLLGYSLGKSQELLCRLGEAGLPLMLHGTVHRLTQIYEQFGHCFPKYERYEAGAARGKVLLCPPNVANSAMLRNLGKKRTAILTGWAVDSSCRYRYQCDAAFPLSDHADYADLLELVRGVQPKQVYTLHGFAADFAQTLRDLGYSAQALSEEEQFSLPFEKEQSVHKIGQNEVELPALASRAVESAPPAAYQPQPDTLWAFSITCSKISGDSHKLEKIRLLAEYLRQLKRESVNLAATWFTGRPFPARQNKILQLGWAALRDAFCAIGQLNVHALHQVYLKHSDLGETAFELLQTKNVTPSLSLAQVNEFFNSLQVTRGPRGKIPLLIDALRACSALEAKYLVKIITGDLRIGLKEGLVEEAVGVAFGQPADAVRQANLLLGDIGETAELAFDNRLNEAVLVPFRPIKFMLASPEPTAQGVWERLCGQSESRSPSAQVATGMLGKPPEASPPSLAETCPTVWLEDKYDGIRCQLHKVGQRVALYSRDLKDITATFPELAESVRQRAVDFVLDGEIVAMRGNQILPFSDLQKRLGRRESDLFMREEVPIEMIAFDLLWLNGRSLLQEPLAERRGCLEKLKLPPRGLRLARITHAGGADEIEAAFIAARGRGNEGLMIKMPTSAYLPGRRGLAWLKLKKAYATLDCVVIGAEYGHGKRSKVLSDYTFAVLDETSGELKPIGKAYTGLTDAEIQELTDHFLKTAVRQQGRFFEVRPDTVIEVAFDRLQVSQRHSSGLAMRFPRIVRLRRDKAVGEIDTLANARRLAVP